MELSNGTLLQGGKYRIEKVLGQGGFGITYLAEHCVLQHKVAVKEFFMKDYCNRAENMSSVFVGSEGSKSLVDRFKGKFLKEARLLADMDNQHIVRVFDAFEENGTAYYVMENLDNGCLNDMLTHVAFSEDTALKFVFQIADALDYIHKNNVLHLDVKPANILLRKNGEAVLIDFGISKRYDDEGGQTSTTPTGISKGYAPLEQYNQGIQTFAPCTDIYSLGATLYKMVTGDTPPEASIVNEDGLPDKPHTISEMTWNAIAKAMCPKRKDRPQSIEDFLHLLDDARPVAFVSGVNNKTSSAVPTDYVDDDKTLLRGQTLQGRVNVRKTTNKNAITFELKGVKFNMIKVEGGTFDMKETVESGFLLLSSKEIVQRTTLSDYYIGETQVTQALWKTVMGVNPSKFRGDNLPVERVSWDECQEFITKLNSLTGKSFRLPTEAEWEFAARGGNNSKHYQYSGSNDLGDVAWYDGNGGDKTHDVATKQPNELGIYDMSGNVWEWCQDWYGDYSSSSQTNPTGASSGAYRVRRGGGWGYFAGRCRSSFRSYITPDYRGSGLGLRLALSE